MSAELTSIPGPVTLYRRDTIFSRAARLVPFGIVIAAGMQWAAHGVVFAPEEAEFETAFVKVVTGVGVALAVVSALVAWRRYAWVRKVFTRGIVVKGTVKNLTSHDVGGKKDAFGKAVPNYAYWATFSYEMHGREWEATLKLPYSGYTYGLVTGGETELLVLNEAPGKPLVRAMYFSGIVKGKAVESERTQRHRGTKAQRHRGFLTIHTHA